MTLREQQSLFLVNIAKLITWAFAQGYELTAGEAWRPQETVDIYVADGRGSGTSLHPLRLAMDFNLFRNGAYLGRTEDHAPLGAYWKSLHPQNRWGGDFSTRKDGNHYSMEWGTWQ